MSKHARIQEVSIRRLSDPKFEKVVDGLQECAAVEALLQHAMSCARRHNYHDASKALAVVLELMGTKNKE